MKLYSQNEHYKLYNGNMLDLFEVIDKETIDAVLTDPPYELNFMNKGWDNSGIAFNKETWQKCYEVLKPGGYLLAFGGSRTYHRIACAIEDAGFEIRDTIMWLYGSGFPKSMSLSKQFEKKNDKEKALKWNGWGTALKPSYESIIVAQKPYSIEIYLLIEILDILNEVIDKCQLNLNANVVEKISKLNQAKQSVEENIVLNNAESKMFTKEDLLEVMDMLQSTLTENTNLNTESLCLNFLVEICNQMNKYTIETKINLITELKILKLLVVENILKNTTKESKMKQLGIKQNALTVEEFLKEEKLKLNYMNILSVQDNAILKEEKNILHPNLNQIIVARKPFKGSCVDNVIKYGVGGINIDECRVPFNGDKWNAQKSGTSSRAFQSEEKTTAGGICEANESGRFPANTILTYDETDFEEVCGGFPNTKTGIVKVGNTNSKGLFGSGKAFIPNQVNGGDSGSASRYFMNCTYTGKDEEIWKQLLVNNVGSNLEILKATKDNIVQMNVEDLLKELKDHYAKYVDNQLNLIETPIVQDIVKILTWDFKIGTSQVIQDFIINSKKCIQFLNLVQFVEKMDNIDTTKTTQNLLKLFGYVKVVITNYILGNIEYDQKRYIYTPKASKKDRDEGCELLDDTVNACSNQAIAELKRGNDNFSDETNSTFNKVYKGKNTHPTVKSTNLMQYLVRLVTPNGGTILDPFNGSGSTGKAVMYENKERNKNYKYIGIELTKEYLPIAKARIEYVCNLVEEEKPKQTTIFDMIGDSND